MSGSARVAALKSVPETAAMAQILLVKSAQFPSAVIPGIAVASILAGSNKFFGDF
jgi:hypothetical protein